MKKFTLFFLIGCMAAWAHVQAENVVKITIAMNKTLPPSYTFSTDFAGEANTIYWSFGDSKFSELKSPTHVYALTGIYTVQVKILDKAGAVWYGSVKETFQGEKNAIPTAICKGGFTASIVPQSATVNSKLVAFTNTSEGETRECKWFFGDGTTSFEKNPQHQYAEYGEYKVCLVNVTADNCRSEICQTVKVPGTAPASIIIAGKGYVKDKTGVDGCGFIIALENGTVLIPAQVVPNFTFKEGQRVELAYEFLPGSPNTCMAGKQVKIHKIFEIAAVTPACKAYFTATNEVWSDPTQMKKVVFANLSTGDIKNSTWIFGDGTTSNELKPTHEYKEYGEYKVCLIIETIAGCKSDYCTIVNVKAPVTDATCYFDLVVKPKDLAANTFLFYAISRSAITSWSWSFGDEGTSTLQNPEHVYAKPGTYTVSCTISTASGCTQAKKITVSVLPPPLPVCPGAISLLLFDPTGTTCNGKAIVKLVDTELKDYADVTYTWSNGATGTIVENLCPDKSYSVHAVVKEVCQKNTSFGFLTKPAWRLETSKGKYTFAVEDPVADVVYKWNFGDGKVAYGSTVDYNYDADGVYNVTLTAINGTSTADASQEVTYLKSLTGVEDMVKTGWRVFPNPATDVLKIEAGALVTGSLRVEILDMKGGQAKVQIFENVHAPYVEMNINDLVEGMYFVRMNDGSRHFEGIKFLKK